MNNICKGPAAKAKTLLTCSKSHEEARWAGAEAVGLGSGRWGHRVNGDSLGDAIALARNLASTPNNTDKFFNRRSNIC